MEDAKPHDEHDWLQQLVGEWAFESESLMGPGQPPMKHHGSESVRAIGKLWVQGESHATMPDGAPATMMLTIGFDPKTGRFVGTWFGSMMTLMWRYDGELDAARKVLTLNAEGPSFEDDTKTAKYQDIIELVSPDHRRFYSQVLGDDGKWTRFMTADYRRKP